MRQTYSFMVALRQTIVLLVLVLNDMLPCSQEDKKQKNPNQTNKNQKVPSKMKIKKTQPPKPSENQPKNCQKSSTVTP